MNDIFSDYSSDWNGGFIAEYKFTWKARLQGIYRRHGIDEYDDAKMKRLRERSKKKRRHRP